MEMRILLGIKTRIENERSRGRLMSHEVVAALIIQSKRILLGQRSSTRKFYPNVWDVFGGHVEPGEHPHKTLIRELQEELGITPTEWNYEETIEASLPEREGAPWDQLKLHLYLVTAWLGIPANLQPDEHDSIQWFSLDQAVELNLAHPAYPELFARYLSP
jgi:8-oxo-dGTP diphosphatase